MKRYCKATIDVFLKKKKQFKKLFNLFDFSYLIKFYYFTCGKKV